MQHPPADIPLTNWPYGQSQASGTISREAGSAAKSPLWPILGVLLACSCVSLEEAPMSKGAIVPGQRTALLVFAAPGPVMSETDSKVESAAKIMPVIALAMQSFQDERDLAASKDLQQYLPADWRPTVHFSSAMAQALGSISFPGRLIGPAEAAIPDELLRSFNKAKDLVDWHERYYYQGPDHPVPRNYAKLLSLDDALVLDVSLAWGVATDQEGNAIANLSAMTRLLRANTMRLLWSHEDSVENKEGMKTLYEFKVEPPLLIAQWEGLMPRLAQMVAASLDKNLRIPGVVATPVQAPVSGPPAAAATPAPASEPAPAAAAPPSPAPEPAPPQPSATTSSTMTATTQDASASTQPQTSTAPTPSPPTAPAPPPQGQ